MSALLSTKFYLPPTPAGFVARPQLFEKLDQAWACRLALVSAPAGAGKTTLVSAWAQAARKGGAALGWLSLDEADNALARFRGYLAACLEESGLPLEAGQPESSGETAAEYVLASIIHGIIGFHRQFILILDDYHVIQNREIHAALGYMLEHAPPRWHLVLLTRSDPPLELARLRVAGQLVELRMDHLRFSTEEAAALLKATAGVQLVEADLAKLNARTEGWAAGLQMAAISLRGRDNAPAFVAAFAGSHRFVFDYLLEQVLNRQAPEMQQFLLKTSVLERLSAPLCDAVAGTGGAGRELLNTLERANLFLAPLDDKRNWYRYHPLFADLLKLVLEQTYPGLAVELNRRACRWHRELGMTPEALHYALAAGDMELAAHLVAENVLALVDQAELMPILLHLDAVRHQQLESMPWLDVAHAWSLAYTGQMARASAALEWAEKGLEALPVKDHRGIAGHIAAVQGYLAWVQGDQQAALAFTEEAAHLLPAAELAVRALNLTTLGNALVQYEANPRAVPVLEQAVALARLAAQSHVFMPAATALIYAYISLGKLHKAHATCLEAVESAGLYQQRSGRLMPAAAGVYAEMAFILGEWGEIAPAIQLARQGLALSERWGQADTTMLCLIHLANSLLLNYDFEGAWQAIQRARQMAQQVSPWFVLNVDHLEVCFWLDRDNVSQANRAAQEAHGALPVSLAARLLLKQNRFNEALALLDRALPEALTSPSLEAVRIGVSQSLALFLKKDERQALAALKWTLELGEAENRLATFVREGEPMEKLLHLAQAKSLSPGFTRRLLAACEARFKPGPAIKPETRHPLSAARNKQSGQGKETLIEPLSERELEILRLLNGPLSTPEIAGQLFISPNTVRTHIKNIYGKLGVHSRSAAVKQARELGFLQ